MNIKFKKKEKTLTVIIEGRLDGVTAPKAERLIGEKFTDDITLLEFDLDKLEYISSAGLRILLSCQKRQEDGKKMKIIHVSRDVMDIFEATGFDSLFDIIR